jgi:hypothetical protein
LAGTAPVKREQLWNIVLVLTLPLCGTVSKNLVISPSIFPRAKNADCPFFPLRGNRKDGGKYRSPIALNNPLKFSTESESKKACGRACNNLVFAKKFDTFVTPCGNLKVLGKLFMFEKFPKLANDPHVSDNRTILVTYCPFVWFP